MGEGAWAEILDWRRLEADMAWAPAWVPTAFVSRGMVLVPGRSGTAPRGRCPDELECLEEAGLFCPDRGRLR